MYLITNGCIVTEEAVLPDHDLLINEDRIWSIIPRGEWKRMEGIEVVDAHGGYITPGFVDIHSDYIENVAAPRPTCLMDFQMSVRETERELISHGITTMFHSLSLFKDSEYMHKPIRNPENVRKFIDIIDQARVGRNLIRHRFHARFEIDNLNEAERLEAYIMEDKVHLVSFMDHTPGQGQYRDLDVYRQMVKSYQSNFADEEIDEMIARHQSKEKVTIDKMREIAKLAEKKGIAIASHDDDTSEKLDLVQSLGATISEFPITMEIAREAKARGMFTTAGAPNILLGGSHNGNLPAAEAIEAGLIDVLCSDYYPPALLQAVFMMHSKFGADLAGMFRLVTLNPARAVKADREIGSIAEGKKADVLIINKVEPDYPVITAVWVDGRLVQQTSYAG